MENKKKKKKEENCNCDNNCNCNENNEKCKCDDKELNSNESTTNDDNELLSKRIKDLEEALLRSKAELINYKKRKDEETDKIIKYAEEDVLKGFLPILDNFERAIGMDDDNLEDEVSKFLDGFKIMYKQIKELLNKFEVVEMDCLDKKFDPAYHQAVVTGKDETKESEIILEVLLKGYMYKDKILRTAMVKVNE